jgi:fido (protein-threonine AMPylation protein)
MFKTPLKDMMARCEVPKTFKMLERPLPERIALSENVGSYNLAEFSRDIERALNEPMPEVITVDWLVHLHRIACHRIDQNVGKLRDHLGMSGFHMFPSPRVLDKLMNEFVDELNEIEQCDWNVKSASMAIMKLMSIHPFSYGNGITAKILFVKLSGVKTALDLDKQEYVKTLVNSDANGFYQYCINNVMIRH